MLVSIGRNAPPFDRIQAIQSAIERDRATQLQPGAHRTAQDNRAGGAGPRSLATKKTRDFGQILMSATS